MKKYSLVPLCFTAALVFVSGCQADNHQATKNDDVQLTEKAPVQEQPNAENGITVATEQNQYPASAEKIIVEIHNDSNTDYMTGAHVFLEKKVDGAWYRVPMKAEAFTEEGIIHPPGKLSVLDLDADDLKYELTPGQYRATIGGLAAPFEVVE